MHPIVLIEASQLQQSLPDLFRIVAPLRISFGSPAGQVVLKMYIIPSPPLYMPLLTLKEPAIHQEQLSVIVFMPNHTT